MARGLLPSVAEDGKVMGLLFLFRRILALLLVLSAAALLNACQLKDESSSAQPVAAPRLEIAPLEKSGADWKIASSDKFTLTAIAPGAASAEMFYQPEGGGSGPHSLGSVAAPADPARGSFPLEVTAAPDFAGEVWAEVTYPSGAKKKTAPVLLLTRTALGVSQKTTATPEDKAAEKAAKTRLRITVDSDESAREDKFTDGRITQAPLKPGDPRLAITVNIPAFRLTLWQNGREVKTYQIGIGQRDFPLPSGERQATEIVFNPRWIPPDSDWVQESKNVEPFEKIEPDDPRNPLGRIKIPLGQAYLIHQAAKPTDIGNLVSHGCARLLEDDLFDLAEKIIAARGLPVTKAQIEQARTTSERRVVQLNTPLPVDLNYDTQVVTGGVLRLYPDVYDRETNTVEKLRAELADYGIGPEVVDDETLRQMLRRVSRTQLFAVSLTDLREGRALSAGWNEPLVEKPAAKPSPQPKRKHKAR
ncbi:MAG TPA: L,D-transpeptidase [Blastocatellia bacterium]|nr:L,D-transpeptidase [Blastocatellia bacterium]